MYLVLFLTSIVVSLISAELSLNSCSQQNELCVDMKSCHYNEANLNSFSWMKKNWRSLKANICKVEKDNWALSVCCPTMLNDEDCGISEGDRVANGNVANPFQYPWMVLLKNYREIFVCGGTLITEQFVLSAAHCENIISVRVGENDLSKELDCNELDEQMDCAPEPQDIMVAKLFSHLKHSDRYKRHDIALFKLVEPAVLGDSVKTICLPVGTPESVIPDRLVIPGWGIDEYGNTFDVLRYGTVEKLPMDECVPRIKNLLKHLTLNQDIHICTHGGKNMSNTCGGDSGGPLQTVNSEGSSFVQYGVVSFGTKTCGDKNNPTLYTNVLPHLGWILETVEGNK